MLHVASVRTPCCKLLRVALAVLRKVWNRSNFWANKSQHFFYSVMAVAMWIIYSLLPNLSATMLHLFAQLFLQCWCHACAHYKCSLKSSGLYPSHDTLQVLALLGAVVSVSTPLPTRTQQLPTLLVQHWCWELLRSFARSFTSSTGSRKLFSSLFVLLFVLLEHYFIADVNT